MLSPPSLGNLTNPDISHSSPVEASLFSPISLPWYGIRWGSLSHTYSSGHMNILPTRIYEAKTLWFFSAKYSAIPDSYLFDIWIEQKDPIHSDILKGQTFNGRYPNRFSHAPKRRAVPSFHSRQNHITNGNSPFAQSTYFRFTIFGCYKLLNRVWIHAVRRKILTISTLW
jgi:hypothetical protein